MFKFGDGNKDNVVDISDITSVIDSYKGKKVLTESEKEGLDTNGDGLVDVSDIVGVIDAYKGKNVGTKLPVKLTGPHEVGGQQVMKLVLNPAAFKKLKIAGMQLYVNGIQLEKHIGEGEDYLKPDVTSPEKIRNWIFATNTLKVKGVDGWNFPDLSIIYLEADAIENLIDDGAEFVAATVRYTSVSDKVSFYTQTPYQSMVVSVENNQVTSIPFPTRNFEGAE